MLLREAIEDFLAYLMVELNRSINTVGGYRKDLNIFIKFLESRGRDDIPLEELNRELLSAYVQYLTRERGNQPNTLRRRIIALKSFCNFLVDADYLDKNPAAALPWPKRPQRHPVYLQREEVEKLFAAAADNGSPVALRNKTALMCLYYTGARVNELVNIKTEDLDFVEGFLKITKGKGGRFRKVPLHPRLEEQLKKYLIEALEFVNGYLFCNRQGLPISTDLVHDFVGECGKKAGLKKKVTPHKIRHSFATNLYRQGVNITTLAKLMGHAEIRTTTVYIHTDLKHLRQAVEKLDVSEKLEAEISELEEFLSEPAGVN